MARSAGLEDLFPEEGQFSFKQGDVIGSSGNAGSSSGPHLHFEIRESKSQLPLNPLFFGYSVDDKKIYAGGEFKEQGKTFSINDPVLIPISKQRRAEIRDKEYMMHYKLLPMTICDIFHGRSPAIYAVKNPRTGKRLKRRYYAVELKKVSFPNNVKLSKITSYEIKNGEIWYKIDGQEEPLKLR